MIWTVGFAAGPAGHQQARQLPVKGQVERVVRAPRRLAARRLAMAAPASSGTRL